MIDVRFCWHVVDVTTTAYQKAVLAIEEFPHASDTAGLVEVGETFYAHLFALFNSHSSNSHNHFVLVFQFFLLYAINSRSAYLCARSIVYFPFVKLFELRGRENRFRASSIRWAKGRIRQVWVRRVLTEYPNFWGTRKFVEGFCQALRTKAQRHLTFLPSTVPLHGKRFVPKLEQDGQRGYSTFKQKYSFPEKYSTQNWLFFCCKWNL